MQHFPFPSSPLSRIQAQNAKSRTRTGKSPRGDGCTSGNADDAPAPPMHISNIRTASASMGDPIYTSNFVIGTAVPKHTVIIFTLQIVVTYFYYVSHGFSADPLAGGWACTSHPGVLGSIPKREEPGKTGRHPMLKYRVPHGSQDSWRLKHLRYGST